MSCRWCGCREGATVSRSPGADGELDLCHICARRSKQGFREPLIRPEGGYQCQACKRGCPTIAAFHAHSKLW